MNILITLSIEYFYQTNYSKRKIFCLCFITYMGHLNFGNILFMFYHIHGTFNFWEFGAAASNIVTGFIKFAPKIAPQKNYCPTGIAKTSFVWAQFCTKLHSKLRHLGRRADIATTILWQSCFWPTKTHSSILSASPPTTKDIATTKPFQSGSWSIKRCYNEFKNP